MKKLAIITLSIAGTMTGCSSKEEIIVYEKNQIPAADHRNYIYGVATIESGERRYLGAAFDMDHKEHVVG